MRQFHLATCHSLLAPRFRLRSSPVLALHKRRMGDVEQVGQSSDQVYYKLVNLDIGIGHMPEPCCQLSLML